MRISREEFVKEARSFIKALKVHNEDQGCSCERSSVLDQWTLEHDATPNDCSFYLSHSPVIRSTVEEFSNSSDSEDYNKEDDIIDETLERDNDVVATAHKKQTKSTEWRFSVVYSETWGVPVLYFSVQWQNNGSPCFRSQVVDMLFSLPHRQQDEASITDSWDFVSQEEHPVTGIPCFMLHPCQTSTRLQLLFGEANNSNKPSFLLSWMSMVFPSVGFELPPNTFSKLDALIMKEQPSLERTNPTVKQMA